MKLKTCKTVLMVVFFVMAAPVYAGGSAEASAQAISHVLEAIGYSVEGGVKLVSGAAAIPLMTAGEIGKVSGEIGNDFWEEANSPPHKPFPVTDEVVTVGPAPAEQLQNSE